MRKVAIISNREADGISRCPELNPGFNPDYDRGMLISLDHRLHGVSLGGSYTRTCCNETEIVQFGKLFFMTHLKQLQKLQVE